MYTSIAHPETIGRVSSCVAPLSGIVIQASGARIGYRQEDKAGRGAIAYTRAAWTTSRDALGDIGAKGSGIQFRDQSKG